MKAMISVHGITSHLWKNISRIIIWSPEQFSFFFSLSSYSSASALCEWCLHIKGMMHMEVVFDKLRMCLLLYVIVHIPMPLPNFCLLHVDQILLMARHLWHPRHLWADEQRSLSPAGHRPHGQLLFHLPLPWTQLLSTTDPLPLGPKWHNGS